MYRELQLAEWYASEEGRRFADRVKSRLDPLMERCFGYHAVQFGLPDLRLLDSSPIGRQFYCAPSGGQIECAPEALPFDAGSIDTLVLMHGLEMTTDPHALLREAERVLVAEGNLFIVGITPLSISCALRKVGGRPVDRFSAWRVSEWLSVLGFGDVHRQTLRREPLPERYRKQDFHWSVAVADFCAAKVLGDGYLLQAKKQVTRMTPLRNSWPRNRVIARPGVVVKPSTQVARDRWGME